MQFIEAHNFSEGKYYTKRCYYESSGYEDQN